jgi:hypothetical protein
MSKLFEVEGSEKHVEKLKELTLSKEIIDEYLDITFSIITYGDIDLAELEQCQPLKEYIDAIGFRFEYNSREYVFILSKDEAQKTEVDLIQINPHNNTPISEADLYTLLRLAAKKYAPKQDIRIEELQIYAYSETFDHDGLNYETKIKGQLDPLMFRKDIEQYFIKEFGKMVRRTIQVNFRDIKLKKIIQKRLNPQKIKSATTHTKNAFLK